MTDQQQGADIKSFEDFWPYYLREHLDSTCRIFHYVGSLWGLVCLLNVFSTGNLMWFVYGVIGGYGMAWIGHFGFGMTGSH